jgi:hypothetical protein
MNAGPGQANSRVEHPTDVGNGQRDALPSHFAPRFLTNRPAFLLVDLEQVDNRIVLRFSWQPARASARRMSEPCMSFMVLPTIAGMPADQLENTQTPDGRKVVVCPAVTRDTVSCATCGLCARCRQSRHPGAWRS